MKPHHPPSLVLCETLRMRIRTKVYPAGQRLPAEKALASEFRVNRLTVRKAISRLRSEGWIVTSKGWGSVVIGTAEPIRGAGETPKRVGVILPFWSEFAGRATNESFLEGASKKAHQHGVQLDVIFTTINECDDPVCVDRWLQRSPDGLVWFWPKMSHLRTLQRLVDARFPLVVVGRQFDALGIPTVAINPSSLGHQAIDHLVERGHREIGILSGTMADPHFGHAVRGMLDAAAFRGVRIPDDQVLQVFDTAEDEPRLCAFMDRWLHKVTAFVALTPNHAFYAIRWARSRGHCIPEDFCLLVRDFGADADVYWDGRRLAKILLPLETMGERCVELMLKCWAAPDGHEVILLPASIRGGDSVVNASQVHRAKADELAPSPAAG